MCRLYALRANETTKVECTLAHSQNALMLQSRSDLTGRAHSDGWGIAFYHGSRPEVEKRASAAYRDLHFSGTAERIYARTVIAHVRQATVGTPRVENSHPFDFGHWVFAHNGTVTGFDVLKDEMERETLPKLQATRYGETDSEQFFLWLLSRLKETGVEVSQAVSDVTRAGEVIAESISELSRRCRAADPESQPKLNIVLTNGATMFATRWNNSLHYVVRRGLMDCEICGVPHVHHEVGNDYRAIVVASEPISDEAWERIPNHSVMTIDSNIHMRLSPIADSHRQFSTESLLSPATHYGDATR